MTALKPVIYESLTPRQRLIASIEALARNDEEEQVRLIKTCPKKAYTQTDAAYADKMTSLQDMMLAVECDMRGCALNFFMLLHLENSSDFESPHDLMAIAPRLIQDMLSIKQAWHDVLTEEGIDPAVMDKVYEPMVHFGIGWVTAIASCFDLQPAPETVMKHKGALKAYLKRATGT